MNYANSIIMTEALLIGSVSFGQEETETPDLAINTKSYSKAVDLRAGGTSGITLRSHLFR